MFFYTVHRRIGITSANDTNIHATNFAKFPLRQICYDLGTTILWSRPSDLG